MTKKHDDDNAIQLIGGLGWQPIQTAPKSERILIWTGQTMYCAFWVKNFVDDHEAWAVAELGGGDRLIAQATHWMPLPEPPNAELSRASTDLNETADG